MNSSSAEKTYFFALTATQTIMFGVIRVIPAQVAFCSCTILQFANSSKSKKNFNGKSNYGNLSYVSSFTFLSE